MNLAEEYAYYQCPDISNCKNNDKCHRVRYLDCDLYDPIVPEKDAESEDKDV